MNISNQNTNQDESPKEIAATALIVILILAATMSFGAALGLLLGEIKHKEYLQGENRKLQNCLAVIRGDQ